VRPLDYAAASLDPSGLLGAWQELNRSATIDHCIARLEASGNLDNLRSFRGTRTPPESRHSHRKASSHRH
jgi:uncharacterized protein